MKERLLTNIEPKQVFRYFEDLTFIPRESGNEEAVSAYLMRFAALHGLECSCDKALNVLIRKPASAGYEDHPGVILQAHMDMVCEKQPGVDFNFFTDPIQFEVDGDRIVSRSTTLGADDGIGVAYMLALLAEENLQHPAIEAVFTSDEERGLVGIKSFDFTQLRGKRLINLDSADEGIVVAGCAGGPMVQSRLPLLRVAADPAKAYFTVHVNDLLGGHSGEDIHRNRGNANKLLCGLLKELHEKLFADIAEVRGGRKANAIPRDARAVIGIDESQINDMDKIVGNYAIAVAEAYEFSDPDISIYCADAPVPEAILTPGSTDMLLNFLDRSDNGVIRMDEMYPDQVETSISLGVVRTREDHAEIWSMIRSSREEQGQLLLDKIETLTQEAGGQMELGAAFPAWQFDPESQLRQTFCSVYKDLFDKETAAMILHAGLEPGIFAQHLDLDMISLGPDVRNLHAPGEYATISSCWRLWKTLKALLAAL